MALRNNTLNLNENNDLTPTIAVNLLAINSFLSSVYVTNYLLIKDLNIDTFHQKMHT